MRRIGRIVSVLLLCALTACVTVQPLSNASVIVRVFDARPLIAEDWWEWVYDAMVECAQLHYGVRPNRPYDAVSWFVVPAGRMGDWMAVYSPEYNIYLDEAHVMNANVLAHEILHYLTGVDHTTSELWAALEQECLT